MAYLGLDVGTGLTKVARSWHTGWLGPGGVPDALPPVQTAITYPRLGGRAIPAHYSEDPRLTRVRCDGFPMLLGTAWSRRQVAAWHGRTPAAVTEDFLDCLGKELDGATAEDADSLTGQDGEVADLVVAVPPMPGAPGTGAGAEIHKALSAVGWHPKRLVAAPVAALLWLQYCNPDLSSARRVLVIDVGAGSADLSLCAMEKGAIRVVDAARVTGETPADGTPVGAASEHDRPLTLVERLITALSVGWQADPGRQELVRLWRALEEALKRKSTRSELDVLLRHATAPRHEREHRNGTALRFGGLDVTAGQLIEAAESLARPIAAAVRDLLSRQADQCWRNFGPGETGTGASAERVVLFGGLTVLWPLRAALLSALGLDPDRPDANGYWPLDDPDHTTAVARGAALVAAGLADPGDTYPHGLLLRVHRQVRGALVNESIELASPGSINLELDDITPAERVDDLGERQPVTITVAAWQSSQAATPPGAAPIPVEIVHRNGDVARASFQPAQPPAPGSYWVGVRGGPDGPAVILGALEGGDEPLRYPLADPLADPVADPVARDPGQSGAQE